MGKQTVKGRIFRSNTLMVLVTLAIFLVINAALVKGYSEFVEHELMASMETALDEEELEQMLAAFTVRRNEFILLFLADGILCVAALALVSRFFTQRLVGHVMEPLEALADGAERIRNHDLSREIDYAGDLEFENVCRAFNEMQGSILAEQEKNRKYEKARADMVAGISHDLRTPLTAVRGTLKGLLDGVASTPQLKERFLETAYRRTGEMDVLLDRLFYLSRLETGAMPLRMEPVELSNFIGSYVEGKRALLEKGKAELTAEFMEPGATVAADPEELCRIFDNLVENSLKYGNRTPLHMKITLKREQGRIHICFCDDGAGVPEEKLPFLFDEFYRGDESRTAQEGNGLGLYIVKALVESMSGSVRAENAGGLAIHMEWKEG